MVRNKIHTLLYSWKRLLVISQFQDYKGFNIIQLCFVIKIVIVTDKNSGTLLYDATSLFKGCDSNFEVKCSNFKSHCKWNIYLTLNNSIDYDSTWKV